MGNWAFTMKMTVCVRVIKGTKILAEIEKMLSKYNSQTGKTDIYNNNHEVTKMIRIKQQK